MYIVQSPSFPFPFLDTLNAKTKYYASANTQYIKPWRAPAPFPETHSFIRPSDDGTKALGHHQRSNRRYPSRLAKPPGRELEAESTNPRFRRQAGPMYHHARRGSDPPERAAGSDRSGVCVSAGVPVGASVWQDECEEADWECGAAGCGEGYFGGGGGGVEEG